MGSLKVGRCGQKWDTLHPMIQHRTRSPALAAAAALTLAAIPAHAELAVGSIAPDFATQGALAGKPLPVALKPLLGKGIVVLYFYPKAFTQGCTLEAHAFAEASADFAKAGATVIGMSADTLDSLEKFSTAECRDTFAVASATPEIIKAYDVPLVRDGVDTGLASRTSYVITPDGRIAFAHTDMDWHSHVEQTLALVQKLNQEH
jgi:thioredoxin-dependent peroxiredoxin